MAALDDQVDTLELINKEISDRLSRLATASAQADTKAALVGGVAATAAQFLASRQNPQPTLTTLGFVAFGLAFIAAVAAYSLTRNHDVPDPRDLAAGFAEAGKAETLANLIATRVIVFETNHKRHRRKVIFWWFSVGFLSAGLALCAAAVVQTQPHDGPSEQSRPTVQPSTGAGASPNARP